MSSPWLRVRVKPIYLMAVAASLVLGAALGNFRPATRVRAVISADRGWLQQAIARRASVEMRDDFHSGLTLWEGRKNWASNWTIAKEGYVRMGHLARYRPAADLTDYRLEFLGQIENKSLGWVFRAKDLDNYYAVKLCVTKAGPRPLVSLVRYQVIGGRRGAPVQIPLRVMVHNNKPWRVALDVKGVSFKVYVEDEAVDAWTDDQLSRGGIGFFGESGERARLYWVKISNHTDWLGRLCAMAAASEAPNGADMSRAAPAPQPTRVFRKNPL